MIDPASDASVVIAVRVRPMLADRLAEMADQERVPRSDVVRRLLAHLDDEPGVTPGAFRQEWRVRWHRPHWQADTATKSRMFERAYDANRFIAKLRAAGALDEVTLEVRAVGVWLDEAPGVIRSPAPSQPCGIMGVAAGALWRTEA